MTEQKKFKINKPWYICPVVATENGDPPGQVQLSGDSVYTGEFFKLPDDRFHRVVLRKVNEQELFWVELEILKELVELV